MKYFLRGILNPIMAFYETRGGYIYTALTVAMLFVVLLTFGFNSAYFSAPQPKLAASVAVSLIVCVLGVLALFLDLLRLGLVPGSTHRDLVEKLRKEPLVEDIIAGRVAGIKGKGIPTERDMTEHLEEIMAVVGGEWKYAPLTEMAKLASKTGLIVLLYTLVSINLTSWAQISIFAGLGPTSDFLAYLHNTVITMYLVGYGTSYPIHPLAYILSIVEVLTGISALIAAVNLVIANVTNNMNYFREAIRSYLLLSA